MRLSLAIKTLFRSPLRTLLTFVLLAAAAFMLVYSASDFALTQREYNRAVSNYHGLCSVEYGVPVPPKTRVDLDDNRFLLSESRSPAKSKELYLYEDYHQKGLTKTEVDYISSLPYISSVSKRYMTGGVSEDYHRLDNNELFYNHANRFVYEATYIKTDTDHTGFMSGYWLNVGSYGQELYLYVSDIKVLAGVSDWVNIPDSSSEAGLTRISFRLPTKEYFNSFKYVEDTANISDLGINRWFIHYRLNPVERELVDSLIPGQRYIFVGHTEPYPTNRWEHSSLGDDTLIDWWPYIYPLEGLPENYLESDEFTKLRELIKVTNDDLHTFDVVYTDDMTTIRRISESRLLLTEGRMLNSADSMQKNPVCVVSKAYLEANNLKLGDKIKLKLGNELFEQFASTGAVASTRQRYASKFAQSEFEIVGSYIDINIDKLRYVDNFWAYSDNTIFVPLSFLPVESEIVNEHEYKPGEITFIVGDAKNIKAFTEECIPKLKEMGLTVYFNDGGWLAIEEQAKQTSFLSLIKLLVYTAASLLAAALTVYLFIGRKKKEYAIMRALGTTKIISARSLFVPLSFVAIIAISIGSSAAILYAGRTAQTTLKIFKESGIEVDDSVPILAAVIGGLGDFLLTLLLTFYNLHRIGKNPPLMLLQENTNRNKRKKEDKLSVITATQEVLTSEVINLQLPQFQILDRAKPRVISHVLHYIIKHSRRAIIKSLMAVILALLLFGAMGQFTSLRDSYSDLYHNIVIKARFVKQVPYTKALKVANSGYVNSPYYEYIYKTGEANSTRVEYCMTSDLRRITEASVSFIDNYNAETVMSLKEKICVLSADFMEELGLKLGDTIELNIDGYLGLVVFKHPEYTMEECVEAYHRHSVYCKIVGSVDSPSFKKTICIPIQAETYFRSLLYPFYLDMAEYVLNNYHQAEEFRNYSKELIESIRTDPPLFFMDTTEADNIYKIYKLIETLYPIAAVIAILIGAVLPGLIIIQSAKEASILRVLGTTKRRTRVMLILEQLVLCLIGLIVAFTILAIVNRADIIKVAEPLSTYCLLHLIGCTVGTTIAAITVTRRKILELLQVKE